MSADAFEKTNMGWQVQQLLNQIGEWIELKLPQVPPQLPNLPNLPWPDWLNQALWLLFQLTFWVLLAVLLTRLALHLFYRLEPSLYSRAASSTGSATRSPVTSSVQTWFKRSQDFYHQGNYREACRSLYMAMLQRLHDTGFAPHQHSRTDGEYIQLIQQLPQQNSYQILLNTHEKLCFGNAEISSEDFDRCQQAYREIVSS